MFLKTLKIFLRLKWQETLGHVKVKETLLVILCACLFGGVLASLTWGLGWLVCTLFHQDKKDIGGIGMFALVCLIVLTAIVLLIIKLCKWLASNWREAKRIAKSS